MLFLKMISLSKCRLRSFRFGDEISLQENANSTAVWMNLRNSFPHPFSVNDAISWISLNRNNPKPNNLAITINDDVVGGIGITQQTDIYQQNAEIGYWLGESFWNKGIMTEAVKAMVDYTFANFQVIRIYAGVFDHNIPSMRVLEKAGFQKEAIHKKAIYKSGEVYDEHLYTILKPGADKPL
jgi:[ribosomal protein S5]-alanine N-acetyltransferase